MSHSTWTTGVACFVDLRAPVCSGNCVTACEGREWSAPGCVQTLGPCACARVCSRGSRDPGVAASRRWPPLLHTSPALPRPLLGSRPVCKHSLFLSVASLAARPEKGYNPGWIMCRPLPGPRTSPRLLLRPPRCCLVGRGVVERPPRTLSS